MDTKSARKTIFAAILISISVFSVFLSLSLYRYLKVTEIKFETEKAALIKENMALQDKADSLDKTVKEKAEAVLTLEAQKKTILDQVKSIEEESKKAMQLYTGQIDILKKENTSLREKMEGLKKFSIIDLIKQAITKEDNENIKKVLEDAMIKVDLIRSGKVVNLEPIVVEDNAGAAEAVLQEEPQTKPVSGQIKTGNVLSVDAASDLIVISMGRKDEIKEGDRCLIFKDGKEMASGEIISTRYRIAAAFVDDIKYKYNIRDIKEGDKVLMKE